jgi:ferredoxin-NADP reductase
VGGYITREMIEKEVPDFFSRVFYFSGPPMMVENYVKLVKSMGVSQKQIKTDYFPGF